MWLPVVILLVLGGFNALLASSNHSSTTFSQELIKQLSLEQALIKSAAPRSDKGLMDFEESLVEVEEEEEVHRTASSKKSQLPGSILSAVLPFLVEGIYFISESGSNFSPASCKATISCRYLLFEVFRI